MSRVSKKIAVSSVAAALMCGLTTAPALATGIPVFDGAAAMNFVQQLLQMKEQVDTAKDQLEEAEKMYDTISGSRGFGSMLRNRDLEKYLPTEWRGIYSDVQSGRLHDITGAVQDILDEEQFTGDTNAAAAAILEREARLAATNKAMGMRAFEGAQRRLQQIEGLMDQISATQDPKAIAELQARIAGEQALIQNETTKLQMMAQLQAAEERLFNQQKQEIMRRDFSASNTVMPEIK